MIRTSVLLTALVLIVNSALAQDEDENLGSELAKCYEQGSQQDRNELPTQLCSYTADISVEDCDFRVEETVRLPHWPGGRFTMAIHKTENTIFRDPTAYLLYKKGPARKDWDYYTYPLGDPISTIDEYLIEFDVDESKEGAVDFVYTYKVVGGVVANTECSSQPNVIGTHVIEWRPVRWGSGAPESGVILNADTLYNATEVDTFPAAATTVGFGGVKQVATVRAEFEEIAQTDLGVTDAVIGLNAGDTCAEVRQCLKVRQEAANAESGGWHAGHYIGIIIAAVACLVFAYYLLKCLCMSAPGRRHGNNHGY